MNPKRDPIVSEFESEDQATRHDRWFREEVAASLADTRPEVPHDQAMARIRATVEKTAKPGS